MLATLTFSACGLFGGGGSSVNRGDIPSYPHAKSVDISEDDLTTFTTDILGRESILYQSATRVFWVTDTGENVAATFDQKLPDAQWRVEDDWSGIASFFGSSWRKGDLKLWIVVFDNLDSGFISDLNKEYGLTGPEPGSTLVVLHLTDTSQPLPDYTATESAAEQSVTATAEAASYAATATAEIANAAIEATQSVQATAAARASVQQTLVDLSDEFDTEQLDTTKWTIYRPDPQRWDLTSNPGFLHLVGTKKRESGYLNIFGIRVPQSDMEVITRLETHNMLNNDNAAWIAFSPDDYPSGAGYTISLGLSLDNYDGHAFYMLACAQDNCSWSYNSLGHELIDFPGNVYLKLVRDGTNYTGYYSLNGNDWTFVGEYKDFPVMVDQIVLGAGGGKEEFDVFFDYVHFDIPANP